MEDALGGGRHCCLLGSGAIGGVGCGVDVEMVMAKGVVTVEVWLVGRTAGEWGGRSIICQVRTVTFDC